MAIPWANFREDVCGSGRDHQRVNGLCYGDVLDGGINVGFGAGVRGEHAGDDFFSGERGEGKRADELLRRSGHDDLHAYAVVLQQAN